MVPTASATIRLPMGTLMETPAQRHVRPPVRRVVELDATPDVVWGTITRSKELAAWFGADAEVDPRPGGAVRFRWPDGSERRGVVEVAERPRRFAFRWRELGRSEHGIEIGETSRVEFQIEPIAGRTRLTVTEHPGIVRTEAIATDSVATHRTPRRMPPLRASA
jgi:uncharacterized protein YndB with AHSA1/START domain